MGSSGSKAVPPPPPLVDPTKPLDWIEQFEGRQVYTKFVDPCAEASKQAMQCLSKNDGDKSKCQPYFDTYNLCKKRWMNQRKEDRRSGKSTPV